MGEKHVCPICGRRIYKSKDGSYKELCFACRLKEESEKKSHKVCKICGKEFVRVGTGVYCDECIKAGRDREDRLKYMKKWHRDNLEEHNKVNREYWSTRKEQRTENYNKWKNRIGEEEFKKRQKGYTSKYIEKKNEECYKKYGMSYASYIHSQVVKKLTETYGVTEQVAKRIVDNHGVPLLKNKVCTVEELSSLRGSTIRAKAKEYNSSKGN